MDAMWFGSDEGAFFEFASISKNRKLSYPWLPKKLASKVNNDKRVTIPHKMNGEVRILSADIALMSSKKHNNDATSIFINQLTRTKNGRYISNFIYTTTSEGLRTEEQALEIRRLFDEYECDYIVLDTNGIGLGVFDALARDIVDPDTAEIYPALSCYNDTNMASRCTVPGADKVIWSVKATAQFNSDAAFLLREGFRSGRIRLLETEYDADQSLSVLPKYKSLSPQERLQFQLPHIQTTLLIDELTKLHHEENNGRVKVYERSGMRKDRYSSLSYNYYVALQLENKLVKRQNMNVDNMFIIKAPSYGNRKEVRTGNGRKNRRNWYQ